MTAKSPLYAPFDDTLSPFSAASFAHIVTRDRFALAVHQRVINPGGWGGKSEGRSEGSADTNAIERFSYSIRGLAEEAEGGKK
jgi:hypothetical protein